MKILILCSGGDAPGMNRFIYNLSKQNELFYARAGFKGLVEGEIFPLSKEKAEMFKNEAGAIILSSRYPKFQERKYFLKGVKNAKDFDVVVVLGGNGSFNGAKELSENKVNAIFVPATIDNDVENSAYSIGFDSAVSQGVYTVKNSMPSINTFCQACLFEVMGRKCSKIAKEVSKQISADYTICNEEDLKFSSIEKLIKERKNNFLGTSIVVRENIMPIDEIAKRLNNHFKEEIVKTQVVGRLQRGGKPTTRELKLVDKFSSAVLNLIKKKEFNKQVLMDDDDTIKILNF